jgi:hypothetical protein
MEILIYAPIENFAQNNPNRLEDCIGEGRVPP